VRVKVSLCLILNYSDFEGRKRVGEKRMKLEEEKSWSSRKKIILLTSTCVYVHVLLKDKRK